MKTHTLELSSVTSIVCDTPRGMKQLFICPGNELQAPLSVYIVQFQIEHVISVVSVLTEH